MDGTSNDECCGPSGCCGPDAAPGGLDRRAFLGISMLGAAGTVVAASDAAGALGVPPEHLVQVGRDKGIPPERVRELKERGQPTRYQGDALQFIGMPIGGIVAGRLYLGGDGKLWLWDVNNPAHPVASQWQGGTYRDPLRPMSPFRQGFALRTTSAGTTRTRSLDSDGFSDITFTGQYPIATVDYGADDVSVTLEAFSPFVPVDVEASSLPATTMSYTVKNTSANNIEVALAGWSENPVCLDSRGHRPILLRSRNFGANGASGFEHSAADGGLPEDPRPDILVEDFERTDHGDWTVEGNAFGSGPVTPDEVPAEMRRFGDLQIQGQRFVTSYAFRAGGDPANPDGPTGRLASPTFTLERRFVAVRVGGGAAEDKTCVNLLVDGEAVGSAAGNDTEPLRLFVFDVGEHEGKQARIEVVDDASGAWGHVNCDHIVLTDAPDLPPLDTIQDHGTFALATLESDADASVHPSLERSETVDDIFDSPDGPTEVDASERTITGAVRVAKTLPPGESVTVTFLVAWHFPVPRAGQFDPLSDVDENTRHHYAGRFDAASAVCGHLGSSFDELAGATRLFVRTWYDDSTLPHWFLERTLAPASTLATTTCHRFDNGRFYCMEGEYCCDGTCQHVWNYAQSVARLFPTLERDTRERVDLGVALGDDGLMDYRGEFTPGAVAHDGQVGTILRIYREHQMAADSSFLQRVWGRVKRALDFMVRADGEPDGTLEGAQYNTLDQTWYGEISWISGLYVAALRAGAAMAGDMGDQDAATRYTGLADTGSTFLAEQLWNADYGYFVHHPDPDHPDATNSNRGSFADQLYGQTYAHQLGLPRIFPRDKTETALANLYGYNFLSDHQGFRSGVALEGGRWFAEQGESGLLMCTWPYGGDAEAPGGGDAYAIGYFNEVWTGQEYQVAAGMFAEGTQELVDHGLALVRAVYDRYDAAKRNPYNEIECSDHYTRAMMSHGSYLALCGYEHHGPAGHLGFAPRMSPEAFAAAFTAAEGWGLYRQERSDGAQTATIEVRHGRLRVRTLAFATPSQPGSVTVTVAGQDVGVQDVAGSVRLTLASEAVVEAGQTLKITMQLGS